MLHDLTDLTETGSDRLEGVAKPVRRESDSWLTEWHHAPIHCRSGALMGPVHEPLPKELMPFRGAWSHRPNKAPVADYS